MSERRYSSITAKPAEDLNEEGPIELTVGGQIWGLSVKAAREVIASLERATDYVEDWEKWQRSKGCN